MRDANERQLELFQLEPGSPLRPRRELLGRVCLQFRYDQAVLISIVGLIGLTVIFACGVARGKQLARHERSFLAHQQTPGTPAASPTQTNSATSPSTQTAPSRAPAPAAPKVDAPSKPATITKSRYAVQVVTYSRPQLAKQEVERLKARGESAFAVARGPHTSVYVGPFASRGHAKKKVVTLKARYADCFVKVL